MKNNPKRAPKIESGIQHILDAFPFAVLLVDPDHQIVAANEAVKRDLGMDESHLIGAYYPAVVHQLGEPVAECPLAEALETGQAAEKEVFDARNASWVNAAVYPTPIVTEHGKPVYLQFIRDITKLKTATAELSRSLEHHRALCNLLQNLQYCQNSAKILDTLIDQVTSLSWLGIAATAVGFLFKANGLELVAHRNVSPSLLKRCRRLNMGECLCGKAAETRRTIVCSSGSNDHSIKYEGMTAHQHVVLPIPHKSEVLGVLALYLNPGDKMDDFRLGFLEAAAAATGSALAGQLAREEVLRTQEKYLAHAISSQEDERKQVAYNLHDQLGQSLSAILLELQSKGRQNTNGGSVQSSVEAQIRALIDQVRQMAGQLRPAILDDFGLESALARKFKDMSGLKGILIDYQSVSSIEDKKRLPAAVEVGLYRVAIEAVENAVSHSAASHVSVVVHWQEGKVTLLVEDDGRGFDYPSVRRDMDRCKGLIEMEERIVVLGGTLRIVTSPEKGTIVRAEVPADTVQ